MDSHRSEGTAPVLITDAQQSRIDEHNARRRRYTLTMGLRIVCIILAAVTHTILWLSLSFVVLACFLPWAAVLIANDRPPKKAERVNRHAGVADDRTLGTRHDPSRVIEG